MAVLITAGNGFVMSNFARHWIESHPDEKVVILDAAALDQLAKKFFASIGQPIRWVEANSIETDIWTRQIERNETTNIVNGATLTPHPYIGEGGAIHDPERERSRRVLDVTVVGTIELLE